MLDEVMHVDAATVRREVPPTALLRLTSDERLVALVRAGSERAFEALFDRHHRGLLAFCRHMLGSPADAEDAVQHTFLAAYSDLLRSEKPIVLRPWLYAIARNRCVSVLRDRRERPVEELPEPATDHLAAEVATREDLRTTLSHVARLPEDQRAALVLAELGDVSHAEIARILGCQREKVKALVFQARSSLTADRTARETPCAEIRAELATLGGALRHTNLRRHVRDCEDCRAFRHQMRGQRRRLGVLAPLAPMLGLKRAVLGAVSSWGGAGSATAGALSSGGLAVTALVTVAVAGGAVAARATVGGGGADRAQAGAVAPAEAREVAPTGAVRGRARAERSPVARARGGSQADVRNAAGIESDQTARRREADRRVKPSAPADSGGEADRGAAPEPVALGGGAANGHGQATRRGRPERANGRGQSEAHRPASPPGTRNQPRPPEPRAANRKPVTPPKANGKPDPATPDHPAKPPPGPPPDAGLAPTAPPEPPASNAGGTGKRNGEDTGHSGESGKP
jgi:RNA polymerase sigma factor (sigma-70 family)